MPENESTMTWKVDISQFSKALQEARKALKHTNDEFTLASSTMEKWSDNVDGLEAKLKQLHGQITAGNRILEIYEKGLADAKKEFGENSREAEIYEEKIVKQRATVNKAETQLRKYTAVLNEIKNEQTETVSATDKLTQEIADQQAEVNRLKQAYKDSIIGNNPEEMQRLSDELVQASTKLAEMKKRMSDAESAANSFDRTINKVSDDQVVAVSKYKSLSLEIEDQQNKVNDLKEAYASAVLQFGKSSYQAQDLARELKGASSELKNMKDRLSEADTEADDLDRSLEQVGTTASKSASGGFTVLKGALANLLSQGIHRVIDGFKNLAKSAISYETSIEGYSIAFEVMTGSAEKAGNIVSRLGDIVKKTPFDMPTLADATKLLMNYGISADEAVDKMIMLGDISQGSSDKMMRIALAYGQMSSAGKVHLTDLKQMIEAGFNPLQEISERTGESMESLYKRISKGTISVKEIETAFENSVAAGGKYYKSMDKQSQSFQGRMSALKETVDSALGKTLQPLLQKISDRLLPKFTKLISEIDTTKLSNGLNEFGNAAIKAFNWIIKNGGTVVEVLQSIAVAFVTYKAVSIISSVVGAFQTLIGAIKTGQTVMTALNTAFGLTPVGLLATGIAGLAAAMAIYAKRTNEAMQEEYGLNKEQQATIDKLVAMTDRYNDLNEVRKESVDSIFAEYGYIDDLKKEYNSLLDENGKVKKGYEDRAKFILTTLADALGVEVKEIQKVIDKNGQLGDSIDKIIEKKKAEALLAANEQMYNQAIKDRAQALTNLTDAQKILDDAEKKYSKTKKDAQEVWDKYYDLLREAPEAAQGYLVTNYDIINANEAAKKSYEEARGKVKDAENAWIDYNSTIKNYEGLAEAIISGDAKKINAAMANMTYNFVTAETGNRESLERQVENYKTNLKNLEDAIDAGTPNVTAKMVEQAKSMVEAAEKELDKLPPEASATGEKAGEDFANSMGSKKELVIGQATGLVKGSEVGINPAIGKLKDAGEKAGEKFGDEIGSDTNKTNAKSSGEDLAEEAVKGAKSENGEDGGATKSGKNFVQGFINGIKNEGLLSTLGKAAKNLAKKAWEALKQGQKEGSPSKLTMQSGIFFGEGYQLGIESMIDPVKAAASDLAKEAVDVIGTSLNDQMRAIGAESGQSMIDGINSIVPNMSDSIGLLKNNVASANAGLSGHNFKSNVVGMHGDTTTQNVTFNQTINSPKAVDRITLYRETNSLLFSAKVRLNNV